MDRMVDRPAVQNFGTAAHPLELEAESLGDRTAAIVVGGDVNLGPMDSQLALAQRVCLRAHSTGCLCVPLCAVRA